METRLNTDKKVTKVFEIFPYMNDNVAEYFKKEREFIVIENNRFSLIDSRLNVFYDSGMKTIIEVVKEHKFKIEKLIGLN